MLSFLGAVIGVSITAFFTSRNNNKNILVGTVTTERAKWRDELRNHTAEFCKLAFGQLRNEDASSRTRLEELRVLIRLRLNPNPEHTLDKTILDAIEKATKGMDRSGGIDVPEQIETIERNVQALLERGMGEGKRGSGATRGPYADISGGHYEGRTDCRKPASFAVALYCGIGSSSLNALVKAFERLHMVRGWNSSCTG